MLSAFLAIFYAQLEKYQNIRKSQQQKCWRCDGSGKVDVERMAWDGEEWVVAGFTTVDCMACEGTGVQK